MRPVTSNRVLEKLKKVGLFTATDARRAGISHHTLYRLAHQNKVQRVGRGVFLHADSELQGEEVDFAVACMKFGNKSAVGGLSALFHYRLTDEAPRQIWVVVPSSKRSWDPLYRCIRTQRSLSKEVEDHGSYRITNLERTIIESLRYSSKIGLQLALKAIRTALARKMTTERKLEIAARNLKSLSILFRHWEAIIS